MPGRSFIVVVLFIVGITISNLQIILLLLLLLLFWNIHV